MLNKNKNEKEPNTMDTKRNMEIKLTVPEIKDIIKRGLEAEGYTVTNINNIKFNIGPDMVDGNYEKTVQVLYGCTVEAYRNR